MLKIIIKRILTSIPILIGVVTLIFVLVRLSGGDPINLIAGENASYELREMLTQKYGFDQPMIVQWGKYMLQLLHGDFGTSLLTNRPVLPDLLFNFKYTLHLMALSTLISIVLGIPFGVITAIKHNTWVDHVVRVVSLIGTSMPAFWFAILLLKFLAVDTKIFPVMGAGDGFTDLLWHLFLPAFTLGFSLMALIARMTRTSMLEVMGEQYMLTAKAKGLPYSSQIMKHAFKNATIPVVTVLGVQMGRQLSMGMVVEVVFFRPGLGSYLQTGITNMDYTTIQGTVIFSAIVLIVINIIVDVVYTLLDPRIEY
jgi:ABC-type dipeptide/oligopeptide/nickel transport system permease component